MSRSIMDFRTSNRFISLERRRLVGDAIDHEGFTFRLGEAHDNIKTHLKNFNSQ